MLHQPPFFVLWLNQDGWRANLLCDEAVHILVLTVLLLKTIQTIDMIANGRIKNWRRTYWTRVAGQLKDSLSTCAAAAHPLPERRSDISGTRQKQSFHHARPSWTYAPSKVS
jgi:hypothetical protein